MVTGDFLSVVVGKLWQLELLHSLLKEHDVAVPIMKVAGNRDQAIISTGLSLVTYLCQPSPIYKLHSIQNTVLKWGSKS